MIDKNWNSILDNYLITHKMSADDYESLDETQKYIINEIKKSLIRIKKIYENDKHKG
jgi:hypothetical protein